MLEDLEDVQLPEELTVPPTTIRAVHGRPVDGARHRMRIGEALVAAGVVTQAHLDACLAEQAATSRPGSQRRLGDIVVSRGLASERDVARGLALMLGFEFVELTAADASPDAVRRIPRQVAGRLRALPLETGPTWLRVAVADPTDRTAVDTLRQVSGVPTITLVVATPTAIAKALEECWNDAPPTSPRDVGLDAVTDLAVDPGEVALPVSAQQAAKDVTLAHAAEEAPYRPPAGWEYLVAELGDQLDVLGRAGWEAVGLSGDRVLLKRPLN